MVYRERILLTGTLTIVSTVIFFAMAKAETINLPQPDTTGSKPLEQVIAARRSVRVFKGTPLTLEQISQILWAGQGMTQHKGRHAFAFRTSPSAGALYPMELYAVTPQGVWRYLPEVHRLEVIIKEDRRQEITRAALGQASIAQAPLSIVICAIYSRVTGKYGSRGRRYTDIEAGHIAQNIHLQAVTMGLGSVPIGAFDDNAVKAAIGAADDEVPLYVIPVGYPAEGG